MKRGEVVAGSGSPVAGRRELILSMLRTSPAPLSIASVAEELGVHPNTVRFHLDALIHAGRVEQLLGAAAGPGRPPILYRASRTMDPNGRSNYRLLATMLTSHLAANAGDPAEEATELGRRWGPSLIDATEGGRGLSRTEAVNRMRTALADLGFEPEPTNGARTKEIRLRHCPFLELIDDHADVICSLHLGMMQGALASMNSTVTVQRLDPLVEPDLCVARLAVVAGQA